MNERSFRFHAVPPAGRRRPGSAHPQTDLRRRLEDQVAATGPLGLLPNCLDDVVDARVWLAIRELGRTDD
ncbi:MAG: hypothetical protein EOO74_08205 [Myxococcales bacterium]|nr:MAG: hypothetical protein EOO74_08205 [Myxococcales bacterium]